MSERFVPADSPAFAALLAKAPRQAAQVSNPGQTPSQTVGPFFAYGLVPRQYGYDFGQPFTHILAQPHAQGERIRIVGQVFDGDGAAVPDAIVEIAHADAHGRYPASREAATQAGFSAFGRCGTGTDPSNRFSFDTILPGPEAPGDAPCVHVCITMRGLLLHAFTRIYFAGQAANATDPVLHAIPEPRRTTVLAQPQGTGLWQFNVHMQGPKETVFFEL